MGPHATQKHITGLLRQHVKWNFGVPVCNVHVNKQTICELPVRAHGQAHATAHVGCRRTQPVLSPFQRQERDLDYCPSLDLCPGSLVWPAQACRPAAAKACRCQAWVRLRPPAWQGQQYRLKAGAPASSHFGTPALLVRLRKTINTRAAPSRARVPGVFHFPVRWHHRSSKVTAVSAVNPEH